MQGQATAEHHTNSLKCLAGFRIVESDPPQMCQIVLFGVEAIQGDALIGDDAGPT